MSITPDSLPQSSEIQFDVKYTIPKYTSTRAIEEALQLSRNPEMDELESQHPYLSIQELDAVLENQPKNEREWFSYVIDYKKVDKDYGLISPLTMFLFRRIYKWKGDNGRHDQ